MKKILIVLAFAGIMCAGCTRTERHVAAGATIGAVAGHAIAGDTGAVVGAGLGAGAGAAVAKDRYYDDDDYYRGRKRYHHRDYDDDYDD